MHACTHTHTTHTGEIGLAELLAAFRRLGVDLTMREGEALVAEADEDGNGIVDVDEFIQMITKMLSDSRGLVELHSSDPGGRGGQGDTETNNDGGFKRVGSIQRLHSVRSQASGTSGAKQVQTQKRMKSSQEADEEAQEADFVSGRLGSMAVCFGLFKVQRHNFAPNVEPLTTARMYAARMLHTPMVVDECGNQIPAMIMSMARKRNIRLRFGPTTLEWSAFSKGRGAIMLSSTDQFDRAEETAAVQQGIVSDGQVVFPAGSLLADGMSTSESLARLDLKDYLERFSMSQVKATGIGSVHWAEERKEQIGSLSELLVGLCILANTVGMACEHFRGDVDMMCHDPLRCPNNIVIMSKEWSDLLNTTNIIFGAVFTVEAAVKIFALGFWRYLGERTNQIDLFLVIMSDIDTALTFLAANFFSVGFLRVVRLLRMLRLVNRFRRIRVLLIKVGASLGSILTVIVIFFFCLATMGLAAMQVKL
jgi:hypothetical protein